MEHIENRTFDEIQVGDTATLDRTLTELDITLFAVMSGDINPAHVDPEYAKSSPFREVIGHGMWSGALISTVLGTEFPGPGTIYLGQNLRFKRPVKVGDTITIRVTAKEKDAEKGKVVLGTSRSARWARRSTWTCGTRRVRPGPTPRPCETSDRPPDGGQGRVRVLRPWAGASPVRGLTVRDSEFRGVAKGSRLEHVGDLVLRNVTLEPAQ